MYYLQRKAGRGQHFCLWNAITLQIIYPLGWPAMEPTCTSTRCWLRGYHGKHIDRASRRDAHKQQAHVAR